MFPWVMKIFSLLCVAATIYCFVKDPTPAMLQGITLTAGMAGLVWFMFAIIGK